KKLALNDLSFEIPKGCACGLVGPNGAGKTTLIKLLLNILPPTSGKVRVFDLDPAKFALEIKQRCGYVPEKHHIYAWMKVRQVLDMTAGIYKNWDDAEQLRLVDLLRLPENSKVKSLSRGELAKLAMIIALAHKPDLLLLDEPTSGLDPLIRGELLDAIGRITESGETTLFFSTHILSDVEMVAKRVVILDEGKVKIDDDLENLKSRFSKVSFLFNEPPSEESAVPEAIRLTKGVREWIALLPGSTDDETAALAKRIGADNWAKQTVAFDEVFAELFNKQPEN
ncbi:MAG: ABC transporter ATP-binding protein, partial [Victivallales bacterium]|nr:ABC transporter ATP-binding protein [Victivallales bacterium]